MGGRFHYSDKAAAESSSGSSQSQQLRESMYLAPRAWDMLRVESFESDFMEA